MSSSSQHKRSVLTLLISTFSSHQTAILGSLRIMRLAKPSMITAVLLLLFLAGLSDAIALPNAAILHNTTSCASPNRTHIQRSPISKRVNPALVAAWEAAEIADNAKLDRLAVYGGGFFNAIIMGNVEQAAALFQHKNRGTPDPRNQNFQVFARNFAPAIRNEWTIEMVSDDLSETLKPLQPLIEGQTVGYPQGSEPPGLQWQTQRSANGEAYPDGQNVCMKFVQNQPFNDKDEAERPPTLGQFRTWFNVVDGIIVVNSAHGPLYMAKNHPGRDPSWDESEEPPTHKQMPWSEHWSDLTFHAWMTLVRRPASTGWNVNTPGVRMNGRMRTSTELRQVLNYIIVQGIILPIDAISVMKRCLQSRRGNTDIPIWPDRERFDVGHWCFYALLAAQDGIGSGITYFLAQHKSDVNIPLSFGMGHKILSYVEITSAKEPDREWVKLATQSNIAYYYNIRTRQTVWQKPDEYVEPNPANDHFFWAPTQIWKVIDFDRNVVTAARAREASWTGGRKLPPYQYCNIPAAIA
ncbi:hypothetical protein CB0940_05094 [Cercospora beticola]|uniref:WW domain-containing protein n=1 Tax=Cercospora beticola TaxID=122368 RepID=A0A2G5HKQ9_CERBT|nr:hypothetical protein CB0940_05094 [Cercospora beticola]PIA93105.1 hypothetical protein CB0940_05094 [Cercospora beticola]WPB02397.1 hypothetical protein RHO25_007031 [Cercospora beticola]CAK1362715.1 unnamed protein product [Cercospora beticola]